jgi:vitamin B12 transporter
MMIFAPWAARRLAAGASRGVRWRARSCARRMALVPSYGQLPSPGLLPEKSRGWDVGVDHEFLGGAAAVSVTYFDNTFRNLFAYDIVNFTTFEGRTVNRARATTDGWEVAFAARFNSRLKARASYTRLDADDEVTGARLIRRPRHTADVEVQLQPSNAWAIGAGVHVVADRLDTVGAVEDYTVTRAFVSYAIREELLLKVRIENALDEAFEEVYGYPALPRAVFGGVEWRF